MTIIILIIVIPFIVLGYFVYSIIYETNDSKNNLNYTSHTTSVTNFPLWWEVEYSGKINYTRLVNQQYNEFLILTSLSEINPDFYNAINLSSSPMYSFIVRSPEMTADPIYGFPPYIELNSPQDLIYVEVGNISYNVTMNFVLKIFYNYIEIPFRLAQTDTYFTDFVFTAKPRYETRIPIHLSESLEKNEIANRLTVGIFKSPEQYTAEDYLLIRELPYMVLNFEINYGNRKPLDLDVEPFAESQILRNSQFHSLMINADLNMPSNTSGARIPNSKWIVEPGQLIEMAFVTNPSGIISEEVEEFLLISMLDWNQVEMNEKPYLLIEVNESENRMGHHGVFSIRAPYEAGYYEFKSFMVINPRSLNGRTNFFPLETSFRFTIVVE